MRDHGYRRGGRTREGRRSAGWWGLWNLPTAAFLILQGCAPAPLTYALQSHFDEAQFERYKEPGKGLVEGTAFLKTRGGDIKRGAGNSVILMPVTPYSREYMTVRVLASPRRLQVTNIAPEFASFVREQTADAVGHFRFDRVLPGDYFIACYISWDVSETEDTGAWAVALAHVDSSETVEVVVTARDRSTMADIIRGERLGSAVSGAPQGARYRVTLEGGAVMWASAVEPRGGGWLRISVAGGTSRTVDESKVVQIIDLSGNDLTPNVVNEGKRLGR